MTNILHHFLQHNTACAQTLNALVIRISIFTWVTSSLLYWYAHCIPVLLVLLQRSRSSRVVFPTNPCFMQPTQANLPRGIKQWGGKYFLYISWSKYLLLHKEFVTFFDKKLIYLQYLKWGSDVRCVVCLVTFHNIVLILNGLLYLSFDVSQFILWVSYMS